MAASYEAGGGEGLAGQVAPGGVAEHPVSAQVGEYPVVVVGIGHDATKAWFLAAARTMAGPAMSISSTDGSDENG